ncbi:MAG: TonB-dependent receptor [Methylococcales bacterium]|nr:MAG: TonB-dependent receptor [Methylococcales bacterium]
MQKIITSSLLLVGFSNPLQAQVNSSDNTLELPNMVVTATRTETPENEVASAMTVITAKDIADRHISNVADALRTVPGLDVVRTGGLGQQTSIFLRGANSNHTLVLVDGVEMNDPSSPTGAFDFAFLQTDNIERIEVVRGAASAAFGSDAIGGVINVITKKGAGKLKLTGVAEGGSYGTWKTGGNISGGTERINYSFDASRLETAGFSAADKNLGNLMPNGYRNTTISGRTGFKVNEALDFGVTLRYGEGKSSLDNGGGKGADDPNFYGTFNELFTRGFGHLKLFDGFWEQTVGVAYSRTDRNNVNGVDSLNNFSSAATNLGQKVKLDYQNIFHVHKSNTVLVGVEEEADSLSSSASSDYPAWSYSSSASIPLKTMNTLGYYLQDQINLFDRSFTTLGVRYDDNNRFGGHETWRANELYTIKETGTRLRGSYGTGFKAPTLNQLYDTIYGTGNVNLKPETSHGWDVGVEQDVFKKLSTLGISYFDNAFNNLIVANVAPYVNQNVSKAKANGIESFVEVRPMTDLTLRGSYTYQQTQNLDTGTQLLRRPRDKASFDTDYRFLEKAHFHVNLLMVGKKSDYASTVAGYAMLNFAGSYDVHKNVQLFARIDNVLNKQYEEVYGYGTSGVAGYGGVKVNY